MPYPQTPPAAPAETKIAGYALIAPSGQYVCSGPRGADETTLASAALLMVRVEDALNMADTLNRYARPGHRVEPIRVPLTDDEKIARATFEDVKRLAQEKHTALREADRFRQLGLVYLVRSPDLRTGTKAWRGNLGASVAIQNALVFEDREYADQASYGHGQVVAVDRVALQVLREIGTDLAREGGNQGHERARGGRGPAHDGARDGRPGA